MPNACSEQSTHERASGAHRSEEGAAMELENPADRAEVAANEARIVIEEVAPRLEGGRFAAKAIAHQASRIHARIFADGHDKLAAEVAWREGKGQPWQKTPLQHLGNDHWEADITPTRIGRTEFIVLAWIDSYASFRYELEKKYAAGQLLELEFREGLDLFQEVLHNAPQEGAAELGEILRSLQDTTEREARFG
ncbi:maltotransferase domain-containing protein, partial [Pseudomonas sp. AU11447]|uniref:maltotransferase domain-containing protein n=1 Tax=Pseudomonas sp. AU11447 TaxID=1843184 RepID=UPI002113F386